MSVSQHRTSLDSSVNHNSHKLGSTTMLRLTLLFTLVFGSFATALTPSAPLPVDHGPTHSQVSVVSPEAVAMPFRGDLAAGKSIDLVKNNRSTAMKVTATVKVCEMSEGAGVLVGATGANASWTKICGAYASEDGNCATASCGGELPPGKTLNVACDGGKGDAGGGLESGCTYDITVE